MPTPEELQVRQRFSEAHARRIDTEVGQIDPNDLWTSVRSKIRDIFWRFNDQPLEETESDLHVLWDTIIQAAIIADKPAQDRLVAEVGFARELGSLSPYDMTTDGVLWSWLPFLVEDVSLAWLENLMRLKTEERLNLAKFTARLVEAGVCAPELGFCAVFVLRETLETPRALKVTEYGESGTSVADLLPAAVAWFEFAGHRLAIYSGENVHDPLSGDHGRLTGVGELAREVGILDPGFSTKRWHFWQQRLEALSSVDDKEIREQARQGMLSMDLWSHWAG